MPEGREPGETVDEAERIDADSELLTSAWERTLEEMEAMADDLREEGWAVVTVGAGDTAPEPPEEGPGNRFGLVSVIPDNDADEVSDVVTSGNFPEYDVFRRAVDRRVFYVTLLSDPVEEQAIIIAGQYPIDEAADLASTAREREKTYTYLERLDGTEVAMFRHEDPEKFFPDELWVEGAETEAEATEDGE